MPPGSATTMKPTRSDPSSRPAICGSLAGYVRCCDATRWPGRAGGRGAGGRGDEIPVNFPRWGSRRTDDVGFPMHALMIWCLRSVASGRLATHACRHRGTRSPRGCRRWSTISTPRMTSSLFGTTTRSRPSTSPTGRWTWRPTRPLASRKTSLSPTSSSRTTSSALRCHSF